MENIAQFMPSSVEAILQEFGLDEKEIKVYLAVLSLGEPPVSEIAKAAQIERTGTYDVLGRLLKQGLVRPVPIGKITGFAAEDPKQLVTQLDERRAKLVAALPQLEELYTKSLVRPQLELLEGENALKQLIEDIKINQPQELLVSLANEDSAEMIEAIRQATKLPIRQLPETITLSLSSIIYGASVVFITAQKNLLGWRINQPDFVHRERALFEVLWQRA